MNTFEFLSHVHASCQIAYRHTFGLIALLILSYFFYFYQSSLFCKPLYFYREQMRVLQRGFCFFEAFEALAFSLTLVLSLAIDYYLFKLPFWLMAAVLLFYYYQRVSHKINLGLIILLDLLVFCFVIALRNGCYRKTLIGIRVLDEGLKYFTILWAHKALRLYKTGGITVISALMVFMWGLFFLHKLR